MSQFTRTSARKEQNSTDISKTTCQKLANGKRPLNSINYHNSNRNDVSGLVEKTDARGDRGNNGDSEGNDKLKKSYLVVVMYL